VGKYIPGGIWPLTAQALLARRHGIAARTSLASGLTALGYNVAVAAAFGCTVDLLGYLDTPWPAWAAAAALAAALIGLMPQCVHTVTRRLTGQAIRLTWNRACLLTALTALNWAANTAALILVNRGTSADAWTLGAAYALAYVVGILVIVAPAGLGAREITFVALTTPALTMAEATAIAVITRALSIAADFLLALGATTAARQSNRGVGTPRHSKDLAR
jgi:glycosyltransferase 2 family protein